MFSAELTHINPASYFWDIGKQYRRRSDAAERITTPRVFGHPRSAERRL